MAVIARLWLLLSDILLGLSGNSSAFAACCVRWAKVCIRRAARGLSVSAEAETLLTATPPLTPTIRDIDPVLHGPVCQCGHVRLDHWGTCCFEGCACTRYQQKTEEKKEG